jgi:maltose O-acetyltransferase
MVNFFKLIIGMAWAYGRRCYRYYKEFNYKRKYAIHPSVHIGLDEDICGNVSIGEGTYINGFGQIRSGEKSKVIIGKNCAIAINVYISTIAPDPIHWTVNDRQFVESDVVIGDNVWIGRNVFIREGIRIGNNAIVGANSVVTHEVPHYAVVGGVPAKILYYTDKEGKKSIN